MNEGVLRWVFRDTASDERYQVPINPNQMTDPLARQRVFAYVSYDRNNRFRSFETPANIVEWSFSGVIYRKQHHDALLAWSKKEANVQITDHLSRTWEVIFKSFDPVERRPTPLKPWRFTYTMTAMVLRKVS